MSPSYFQNDRAFERCANTGDTPCSRNVQGYNNIRPAVSLIGDLEVLLGDGTTNNPYILKLN